jgi:hypothetical protein
MGSALGGALSMGAFAAASGIGLALFAWIGQRVHQSDTGRWVLATALTLGALFVLLRPIVASALLPCCRVS